MTLLQGDCRDVMDLCIASDSIDAIVTDPPYELTSARPGGRSPATQGKVMKGFMGMEWDGSGVAFDVETWRQALRVLKPGGHLLAFSGTRTYHRMVCAIEDAGFEIRDQIAWMFGSGFPKSLDVSKAIDKAAGAEREVIGQRKKLQSYGANDVYGDGPDKGGVQLFTAPATAAAAAAWHGWGTSLKPGYEPVVVARKPLIGTVAANVLVHGTGALNIDGCRVPGWNDADLKNMAVSSSGIKAQGAVPFLKGAAAASGDPIVANALCRWPANLIHDGSDEVLAAFPQAMGQLADARNDGEAQGNAVYGALKYQCTAAARVELDKSAARFFYCAKSSKKDRGVANGHPTVKPTDLMRYLCRLVTPPGGLILDPFTGSGSTGKAAMLEGFRFTGIEMSAEYLEIARARIAAVDAPLLG